MVEIYMPDGTALATIIANLNVFASNPATSKGEGEIIYNSTDSKVYMNVGTTGTPSWTNISGAGGLSDIVDDVTPQLGGDLDCNTKKITGVTEMQTTTSILFKKV